MSADVIQHPTAPRVVTATHDIAARPRRRLPRIERLPFDRLRLVLEASWEIDTMARALLGGSDVDQEQEKFLQRAFAIRVRDLASVGMSVTGGDDGRETAEMHEVVHGVKLMERRS